MQVAQLIERAEKAKGGTNALARELHVPNTVVCGWKNGSRTCAAEDRALLAFIAGLDPFEEIAEAMLERWEGKLKGEQLAQVFGKRKGPHEGALMLAERVGFEPTVPCGTPDFESGTFDHSATSPDPVHRGQRRSPLL